MIKVRKEVPWSLGLFYLLLISPGGRSREREGDKNLAPVAGSLWWTLPLECGLQMVIRSIAFGLHCNSGMLGKGLLSSL